MTEISLRQAKIIAEDGMTDSLNEGVCGVVFHKPFMPSILAHVKPSVHVLRQNTWRDIVPDMDLSDKPFGAIASRIIWHRRLEGLEQKDYAEKAGLTRSQLSNWETGTSRVSIDGAIKLRHTYGLSLDFIYEGIADTLPMTLRSAWMDRPEVKASK